MDKFFFDLLKGSEMEQVILYFTRAHLTRDFNDIKNAYVLLNKILQDFKNGTYTEDSNYSVGCGFIYLLRNNFIEGNEDVIFSSIDEKAFKDVCFRSKESRTELFSLLHYLILRTSGNPSQVNNRILLKNKQLLCQLLDVIGREKRGNTLFDGRIESILENLSRSGFARGLIQDILKREHHEKIRLKKIKEKDITFVIPVRIDCQERIRNLCVLLKQLNKITGSSVIILEADSKPRFECKENNFISYHFIEDHDPVFYRTKYRNILLSKIKTQIAGVWDTDVVIPGEQIISSIQDIQKGCIMSFPYDGRFFSLSPEVSKKYCECLSIQFLMENIKYYSQDFGTYSTGGAFLVNKDEYLKCGGENEHFYGWGPEDIERVKRIEILGFDIQRTEGPLFHLHHPRFSWFDNENTEVNNRTEFIKICNMTRKELCDNMKTWKTSRM